MEIAEYKNIYENEENHFFYTSNHRIILFLINKYAKGRLNLSVLDAGCGTGLLGKKLNQYGNVTGIDNNEEALKYSRKRGLSVKKASIDKIPYRDRSFDLITCIDVIYHKSIKDDEAALKEMFRVLKPGGLLVLRVPAFKFLYSSHDIFVKTARRYTKKELEGKLKSVGFSVKKISYMNSILFIPALIKARIEKLREIKGSSAIMHLPPLFNRLFSFFLLLEKYLISFLDLPFGIGLIAVCQKNE